MNDITVKKVKTMSDLHKVYELTYLSFVSAGLCDTLQNKMLIHHPDLDVIPETQIFLAEIGQQPVGSISFTIDNKFGMQVEHDFKEETVKFRKNFKNLANSWRIVVHPRHRSNSTIVKKLIGTAACCFKKFDTEVCLFTFSPRHARIYERMINAEIVTYGKDNNKLIKAEHADVALVKLHKEKLQESWYNVIEDQATIFE